MYNYTYLGKFNVQDLYDQIKDTCDFADPNAHPLRCCLCLNVNVIIITMYQYTLIPAVKHV